MVGNPADSSFTTTIKCDGSDVANNNLQVKVLLNDAQWMIGSNHHVALPQDSSTTATDIFYPWFTSTKGTFSYLTKVFSKQLNNYRDVIVYLPPSFTENVLKPYKNVLLMHDGQNLFDPKTSAFGCWNAQNSLDSGIVNGTLDEVVVIGAYNTPNRNNEYTYSFDPSEGFGGLGDLYLDWLVDTLLPLVAASKFRVQLQRETLGIMGSSLGGLISCYAGWTRPSVFGRVGCMSSSFWWDDVDFETTVLPGHPAPADPKPRTYMDSGTGSPGERECGIYTAEIQDYMLAAGYSSGATVSTFVDKGGQHNEASWGARLPIPLQFLYPATSA